MVPTGHIWPPPPPPNGQIDLRDIFPQVIGRLSTNSYRPDHVGLEWVSEKHFGKLIASVRVKYPEGSTGRVWFLFTWPTKRGVLCGKGTQVTFHVNKTRMEWFVPVCPYEKFYRKRGFLLKLAEVIGRARQGE